MKIRPFRKIAQKQINTRKKEQDYFLTVHCMAFRKKKKVTADFSAFVMSVTL